MSDRIPFNPSSHVPLNFDICWNFAVKHNSHPTGTITRRSDRATVEVYMDMTVPLETNVFGLFPDKEGEVENPNEYPTT